MIYVYIYIYMCVCVRMYIDFSSSKLCSKTHAGLSEMKLYAKP